MRNFLVWMYLVAGLLVLSTAVDNIKGRRKSLKCSQSSLASCRCRTKNIVLCDKTDCMNSLPTKDLTVDERAKIVTLRVTRQMNLTEVTDYDLNGLFSLKTAKIYKNGIVLVGQYAFEDLQRLERLDMHGNKLTQIPTAIRSLSNLRQLNLGANQINYIEPGVFSENTKLEFLILRNNRINSFPLSLPISLKKISVVGNMLTSVGDIKYLDQLEILRLDGNNFTEVPSGPLSLQELTICSNKLTDKALTENTFQGLENLRRLRFSSNPQITQINSDVFQSLREVREIDLSFCSIESIAAQAFACSSSLQYLALEGNNLNVFDRDWLMYNRRFRGISLAGNPWVCSCAFISQLKNLEDEVNRRINRVVLKHGGKTSREYLNAEFKNDYSKLVCEEVAEPLDGFVDGLDRLNATSYFSADCVEEQEVWKFRRNNKCLFRELVPDDDDDEDYELETDEEINHHKQKQTTEPTSTTTTTEPTTTTTEPTTTEPTTTTTEPTTTTTEPTTTTTEPTTTTTEPTTTTTEPTTTEPTTTTTVEQIDKKVKWCIQGTIPCVFPFEYSGKIYDGECVESYYYDDWCYDASGNWDSCVPCKN